MAQFNTTELDFDKIKTNLVDYFKSDPTFKDWDFEGSGLTTLLNVLAYNTHYNAILSHMSMNESFLDSAQVRSNVVSRAKLLGYVPRSAGAATASIQMVVTPPEGVTDHIMTIPEYTRFKAVVDGKSYSFLSETQSATLTGGVYTFSDIKLTQGLYKVSNFIVDKMVSQRFTIPERNVDSSTIVVRVFPNPQSDESDTYGRFTDFVGDRNKDSQIYFLNEGTNGKYEVSFGNDVFGKSPSATSRIELSYIVSDGSVTNGASQFKFVSWSDNTYRPSSKKVITTNSPAQGGDIRESIEEIKYNAPISFVAQNRAVTASDYYALLIHEVKGIDSLSVWGGEDHDVPNLLSCSGQTFNLNLGHVFICCKPTGTGKILTTEKKSEITTFLEKKGIVGMKHDILDPEYTYLYFDINYKFNPQLTAKSRSTINNDINQEVKIYSDTILKSFDGVFRHSNFVSKIDKISTAILNTTARIRAYKEMALGPDLYPNHDPSDYGLQVSFGFKIDGIPEQTASVFKKAIFYKSETTWYQIVDYPNADSGNTLVIGENRRPLFIKDGDTKLGEAGYVDLHTGDVIFNLQSHIPSDPYAIIKVHVVPASNDIVAKRERIITIDETLNIYNGDIDTAYSGSGNVNYDTFDREY